MASLLSPVSFRLGVVSFDVSSDEVQTTNGEDAEIGFRRGRCLEALAEPGEVFLDVDGEPLGSLPARIEIVPDALTVLGPSA